MGSSEALPASLTKACDDICIIDTHEHMPNESVVLGRDSGFFDFFQHYTSSDLVSAGMSRENLTRMRDPESGLSLEERWALIEPYWPYTRTTGYGRAMLEYMRDLFGIDDINADTFVELSRRVREARKPGWYRTVLKEKGNIDTCLVVIWPGESIDVDREFFRAAPILDHYAIPATRADLETLEKQSSCRIQTLDQLMSAQEAKLHEFMAKGIAAVKLFLAYRRTLHFDRVDKGTAARAFDRIWLSQAQDLSFEDLKPLQDFMTRRMIALAADNDVPIQVHTGLQEGNGNYIGNADPSLMTNLFMEYADARFDLFHAGYPYTGELTAIVKYFSNVRANLCWIQAVSPTVFKRTLGDWLEIIPVNKIFAVGGDSNYVEGAYGHCKIARRLVAEVLADKVREGYFSEQEATWVAGRILRENAAEFYGI